MITVLFFLSMLLGDTKFFYIMESTYTLKCPLLLAKPLHPTSEVPYLVFSLII